ncbi:MAG: hypothetical protein VYB50_04255 [Candidatus Thermoplasmatota archaeon]|nr:hypothetical protein [Candidatus Thermoplasmatota archaeon]
MAAPRPPDGWLEAHVNFDRLCSLRETDPEKVEEAYNKLVELVTNVTDDYDKYEEYSEMKIWNKVLTYCKNRKERQKYYGDWIAEKVSAEEFERRLEEEFNVAKEYYAETSEEFLKTQWARIVAANTFDYYIYCRTTLFNGDETVDCLNTIQECIDFVESVMDDQGRKIQRSLEDWFPYHDKDGHMENTPRAMYEELTTIQHQFYLEKLGLERDEDIAKGATSYWKSMRRRRIFTDELRERRMDLGCMLMGNLLHNEYPDWKNEMQEIWRDVRQEFGLDEIKDIENKAIDIAPNSMVEALALAIIGNLDDVRYWHEAIGKGVEEGLDDSWPIYNYLLNEPDKFGSTIGHHILKHLMDGGVTKEVAQEGWEDDEQAHLELIVNHLWDQDKMKIIQEQYFTSIYERGYHHPDPKVWIKRGLTYIHRSDSDNPTLVKIYFGKNEDKWLEINGRGYQQFNTSLTSKEKKSQGPFGINVYTWDAIPKSQEAIQTIEDFFNQYNPNEEENVGEFILLLGRIVHALSFAVRRNDLRLERKGKNARESALWTRGFLGHDDIKWNGADYPKKINPITILGDVLSQFKKQIQECYKLAGDVPFFVRKIDDSDAYGMVHDDERMTNILHDTNDNMFVIDFEHSHFSLKEEDQSWSVFNLRDERPFPNKIIERDDWREKFWDEESNRFLYKHLSYSWSGELYSDSIRSCAGAVSNLAVETMCNDKPDVWFKDPNKKQLMEEIIESIIQSSDQLFLEKCGEGYFEGVRNLYRIYLVERCIIECLHRQEIIYPEGENGMDKNFELWITKVFDIFFNTLKNPR